MAAVTGTVQDAFGFITPIGPRKTSANAVVESCYAVITFAGTYASADDATVTAAAIATKITSQRRDGKTVTVKQIAFAAPGDEAGALIFASHPTLSGTTFTTQLLQADNSTERADGAMGTWNSGVCFYVNYTAV